MNAFDIHGLTKRFGDKAAVDAVDLQVPAGSWFGLVGPNGAGKTTTLSMAVGLLRPDDGIIEAFGIGVWGRPDEAKAVLGVLPDGRSLPRRLTGREVLTYLGLLRGLPGDVVSERTDELLSVLDLGAAERTLVADYSTGMGKKLGLAVALLHAPRLLVLDEPFEGVDPVSAVTVRSILAHFVAQGGSVVMSSHVMALVEQHCDHVGVMDHGRVVAAGPLDEVRGAASLEEVFTTIVGARDVAEGALAWLAS